jgi:5-methylcytosine-specific restriction endonuclease McrA
MATFKCIRCGLVFEKDTGGKRSICDKCKKPIVVNGYSKCPKFLRLAYLRATNNLCQICNKQFNDNELDIHRIKRGNQGGKYTIAKLNSKENNVKVVCKECHRKIHSKEFTT